MISSISFSGTAYEASLVQDETFVRHRADYLRKSIKSDYEGYNDLLCDNYQLQQIRQEFIDGEGWEDEDIVGIQNEISETLKTQRDIICNIQCNEYKLREVLKYLKSVNGQSN